MNSLVNPHKRPYATFFTAENTEDVYSVLYPNFLCALCGENNTTAMKISLIAAVARNRVIGKDNAMPWHMPADLKYFKRITLGKPVIMGRKTFDSIGRPLPGRTNIIVTRDADYRAEGCVVVHSVEHALRAAEGAEEAMVIGGANLFKQLLPRASRIYLTEIKGDFPGESYFPALQPSHWRECEHQDHPADAANPYPYSFVVLERVNPTAATQGPGVGRCGD